MSDTDTETTTAEYREYARKAFDTVYRNHGFTSKSKDLARETEQGIFDSWSISEPIHWSPYYQRCAMVLGHLEPSTYVGNTRLLERVREGAVVPGDLGRMTPHQLFPEHWDPILTRIESQRSHDRKCTGLKTNQFKCLRCHKNVCTYYQSQNRSADEPMNTFITCLNCGNQWKE